jgi:hypothetical protein
LRDSFDFNPVYYVSVGNDLGSSSDVEEMEELNSREGKDKKFKLIEEIKHNIEELDRVEADEKERMRINNMTIEEWFNFANSK